MLILAFVFEFIAAFYSPLFLVALAIMLGLFLLDQRLPDSPFPFLLMATLLVFVVAPAAGFFSARPTRSTHAGCDAL